MNVDTPIIHIKGVGTVISKKLSNIGLNTIGDILDYFPRKYNNYQNLKPVNSIVPGLVTVAGKFINIKQRYAKRGLHITEADLSDDTGKVHVVWFNQPYRAKNIKKEKYILQGNYDLVGRRLQIVNPSLELYESIGTAKSTIVPIYSEKSNIKSQQISKIIKTVFDSNLEIPEVLPEHVIKKHNLLPRYTAYKYIHLPSTDNNVDLAKKIFAFEELYIAMLASNKIKLQNNAVESKIINFDINVAQEYIRSLPFELTKDQKIVAWQIFKDINKNIPMNRLIEGDVGSGKTVVAAFATIMALESNCQVALVAPTELLARQHYNTLKKLFSHTKHKEDVRLLVGNQKKSTRQEILKDTITHRASCIVGTHAILQKNVKWSSLGLVIIDEQHRFGVKQRQELYNNQKNMPHILCMTATPIPRSLALTIYGELSISIIASQPKSKAQIKTSIVSPNSTTQMYNQIINQLQKGFQAYVVCPLIEDSSSIKVPSAQNAYKALSQKEFKNFKVGLMHGKLKSQQKEEIMNKFMNKEIDVLVSTTVIEVGVDVPNATEMVILGADRFGLAQLHQIRGRVGRGKDAGNCYLVMSDSNKPSSRIEALVNTNNGFKLAEYDLKIRGPGAIYGHRQHGELDLRFVELSDHRLIAKVREEVDQSVYVIDNMVKYPYLAQKIERALKLTYLN